MNAPLPCPACGTPTESLKAFRLPLLLVFLVAFWSLRHGTVVACPRCMRRELGRLTLVNILPANLLWLVLLLPWYGVAALWTFRPGHSRRVQQTLAPPGGYRDAAAPISPQPVVSGAPWRQDPALAPYADPARPDDFEATFVYTHRGGQKERLPVRVLRHEGDVYRAIVLAHSRVEPGVHEGLEVFVRPSLVSPPLAWLPPAARDNLAQWDARCTSCGFDLCFTPAFEVARALDPHLRPGQEPASLTTTCPYCRGTMTLQRRGPIPPQEPAAATKRWRVATIAAAVVSALLVAGAGASSESAGVAATYGATIVIGVPLGAWLSSDWAAREGKPWLLPPLVGLGVAAVLFGLALFFFEAIFPAL